MVACWGSGGQLPQVSGLHGTHGQGDYYLGMVVVRIETSLSNNSKAGGGLEEQKRNSKKFLERGTELQKKWGLK